MKVIGIHVGHSYLYYAYDYKKQAIPHGGDLVGSVETTVRGAQARVLRALQRASIEEQCHTRFIVFYSANTPDNERHVQGALTEIKKVFKHCGIPALVALNEDANNAQLSQELKDAFSSFKAIDAKDDDAKKLIRNEVHVQLKKQTQLLSQLQTLDQQLGDLSNKSDLLGEEGHDNAALAARTLIERLKQHAEVFAKSLSVEAYHAFKKEAKLALDVAHLELDQHRGWKRLLSNVGLCVLGLGIFYGIAVLINNGNLFFNKTDTTEKLDAIEQTTDLMAAFIDSTPQKHMGVC